MSDKTPWYDNDAFWRQMKDVMFNPARLQNTPLEVDNILALTGVTLPADVLDLCCGVGRHTLEFSRRGGRVVGVDRTAVYLDEARSRARRDNLDIEIIQLDMREFCRPMSFDLVVNLFTSFGYFENPQDDVRVLENVYASLRPGGWFVLEMVGKEILARIFSARDWDVLEDGTLFLQERTVARDWSWMENRWILVKNGAQREHAFSHRLYAATEFKSLLERVGFADVRIFGNLAGAPYNQKAERLISVARK